MKIKLLILSAIVFFIPVGCDKNAGNEEFVPQTITPILIEQGVLYGERRNITQCEMIIKTPGEWDNLIAVMNSDPLSSYYFQGKDVDFSNYQVIAVFDELRDKSGWSIDITDITEYEDCITVTVQNLQKGSVNPATIRPFHIIMIPASDKKIVFQQKDETEEEFENPFRDNIIGTWKLIEIESRLNYQEPDTIDYSKSNIIYDFRSDDILVITGYVNDDLLEGEHLFSYQKPNVCPTCLPGPNLQIDDRKAVNCLSFKKDKKMTMGCEDIITEQVVDENGLIIEQGNVLKRYKTFVQF
ncbi:MAG: hypothetical protein LBJ72_13970 [Dysgonamonadaceae bacterium]|jgi:hypothetical protein|nr:hypothetical protein [Dysgonamonadaceae bacterium]